MRPDAGLNILVTKTLTLPEVEPHQLAAIEAAAGPGSTVTVVDSPREGIDQAADVDVILGIAPPRLLAAAPNLRWVHATASGIDMFMYPEFVDSGVILTGEKGLVGGHLADTAFGLLLALTRRVATAVRLGPEGWSQENREMMRFSEVELEGLTMGIIGYGGTGRHLARRAQAFGMNVIAVDRFPRSDSASVDSLDATDDLLARSDVVALGLPLTEETRGLCDEAFLAKMKPTAILVNVTRGEIMDGPALERALVDGMIGGAALDVAPVEPLPADSVLWTLDNVVMTPHTAGASQHRAQRNIDRFCRNLVAFGRGEPLEGVVDIEAGF